MDILSINELLDALEEHGGDYVIKATRKRPISSFALRALYSDFCDKPEHLLCLAQYPLLPPELALAIVGDLAETQAEAAAALAANPRTPQQGLNRLAAHSSASVRIAVARNPNVGPKECQMLAQDSSLFARAAIAANPALPTYLQSILALDPEPAVKIALACRENLDADVAHWLSLDESILVKAALIQNAALEPEQFQMWADSEDESLQSLLLRRVDAIPEAARRSLRFSAHPSVRFAALAQAPLSPAEMLWLAESDSVDDRARLAQWAELPTAIQRILAQDTSDKVRRHLAASSNLQPDIAERIATSYDLQACATLAKNPAASHAVITELCLHPDPQVATLVAYREDLTAEHWDLLINQRSDNAVAEHIAFLAIDYPDVAETAAERFAASRNPSLRAFAASARALSPATLALLCRDHCDKVREAAARNPHASEACLRALCLDPNRDIANVAEKALAQRIHIADTHRSSLAPTKPPSSPFAAPASDTRHKILNRIISFFKE